MNSENDEDLTEPVTSWQLGAKAELRTLFDKCLINTGNYLNM